MLRKSPGILTCDSCVQSATYKVFSTRLASFQHTTVGIEELRCTGGAGETTNEVSD